MAVSTKCWKYLLMVYSALFGISALVLFAGGGYLLYQLFVYRHFVGAGLQHPAILLLFLGLLSCSVAWLGWQASASLHGFHIILFGVLLMLVVGAEFGCFVWSLVVWERTDLDVKTAIDLFFTLAVVGKDEYAVGRWDRLQYQMECCGVGGPADYKSTGAMPYSCCGQGPLQAGPAYAADCAAVFQRGCARPLYEHARQQLLAVSMAALVASVVQSCGIFCAFCLIRSLRRDRDNNRSRQSRNSTLQEEALLHSSAPMKY